MVCSVLRRLSLFLVISALLALSPSAAWADDFKPGEAIEYKVRGAWPEKWERGVYIRALPNGTQVLIYEKPTEFFPEGFQIAFDPADIRRVGAVPAGETKPGGGVAAPRLPAPGPVPGGGAAPPPVIGPAGPGPQAQGPLPRDCPAGGLMGKEEAISFARAKIGGDPWKNPPRDENIAQIRDCIRGRGTSFTADDDFRVRMNAQSSYSSAIGWAVDSNRGPHPALRDYFGTWLLRAANRGSHSAGTDASGRPTTTTTDSQAESGQLTINADGTYVWKAFRKDPESQWLRGQWREVTPDEQNAWEGGPAIWLLKAKQGYDCMVRVGRDPAWPGWVDVGMGKARTPVEYGRRQ